MTNDGLLHIGINIRKNAIHDAFRNLQEDFLLRMLDTAFVQYRNKIHLVFFGDSLNEYLRAVHDVNVKTLLKLYTYSDITEVWLKSQNAWDVQSDMLERVGLIIGPNSGAFDLALILSRKTDGFAIRFFNDRDFFHNAYLNNLKRVIDVETMSSDSSDISVLQTIIDQLLSRSEITPYCMRCNKLSDFHDIENTSASYMSELDKALLYWGLRNFHTTQTKDYITIKVEEKKFVIPIHLNAVSDKILKSAHIIFVFTEDEITAVYRRKISMSRIRVAGKFSLKGYNRRFYFLYRNLTEVTDVLGDQGLLHNWNFSGIITREINTSLGRPF